MSDPEEQPKIIIDEDWKSQVHAEKEAAEMAEAANADGGTTDASESTAGDEEQPMPPLPPASFPELVTMFAMQASVSLQQAADPNAEQRSEHLSYAKHFIDLLSVVEEKTKGNLSQEEAKMLDARLHELRMAFVSLNH